MRPQLYIAAGLAVGRPRARVGGRRGGHGRHAGSGEREEEAIYEGFESDRLFYIFNLLLLDRRIVFFT